MLGNIIYNHNTTITSKMETFSSVVVVVVVFVYVFVFYIGVNGCRMCPMSGIRLDRIR